jgi:hypothetical protein
MRTPLRNSLRSVFVCSHITFSVELANERFLPQCLHAPRLSRPFGASITQWWTHFARTLLVVA